MLYVCDIESPRVNTKFPVPGLPSISQRKDCCAAYVLHAVCSAAGKRKVRIYGCVVAAMTRTGESKLRHRACQSDQACILQGARAE